MGLGLGHNSITDEAQKGRVNTNKSCYLKKQNGETNDNGV